MEINLMASVVAAIAMFVVGALWYMGIFAKQWGQIHGFDKYDKKTQKEMQSKMAPYFAVQILVTLLSAIVLSSLASQMPTVSLYRIVFALWIGFVVPAQVSAVIFGGTEPKWIVKKTLIMTSGTLATLMTASWVVTMIQR